MGIGGAAVSNVVAVSNAVTSNAVSVSNAVTQGITSIPAMVKPKSEPSLKPSSMRNIRQARTQPTQRRKVQSIFIVRHGDRWDYNDPTWRSTAERPHDPPLSDLGHNQAVETGIFLDKILSSEGLTSEDITVLCSPFLRCVETANGIVKSFRRTPGSVNRTVKICPEFSVWEMDGKDGRLHKGLPLMSERKCYFPRLEHTHRSLFVPQLPESRADCITRCDRVIKDINKAYPFRAGQAIIIVTHAAPAVALVKAAVGIKLDKVNPAGPCAVYRLDRSLKTGEAWEMDPFWMEGGMNGHTNHMKSLGKSTVPWNNFGPNGEYTGPSKD